MHPILLAGGWVLILTGWAGGSVLYEATKVPFVALGGVTWAVGRLVEFKKGLLTGPLGTDWLESGAAAGAGWATLFDRNAWTWGMCWATSSEKEESLRRWDEIINRIVTHWQAGSDLWRFAVPAAERCGYCLLDISWPPLLVVAVAVAVVHW